MFVARFDDDVYLFFNIIVGRKTTVPEFEIFTSVIF